MNQRINRSFLFGLLIILLAPLAAAEDVVPKERFMIWWDHVNPAMTTDYEAAIKDMISAYSKAEIENLAWTTIQNTESYAYLIPLGENYGGADTFIENWGSATETIGKERAKAMNSKAAKAIYHHRAAFATFRPDLSYAPGGDYKASDGGFRQYDMYYGIPGREDDLEAIAKEWVQLFTKNKIKQGFYLYQVTIGEDLPLYIVVQRAESAAAFHNAAEKIYTDMKSDWDALDAKTQLVTRRHRSDHGMVRPDLAYPPSESKRMARN